MPDKEEGDTSKIQNVTRLAKMKADQGDDLFEPEMPEIDAPHMIEYLFDAGPMSGDRGLTTTEILDWAEGTGAELTGWEFQMLYRLSKEMTTAFITSRNPEAEAPWEDAPFVVPADKVRQGRIKAAFTF